MSRFQIGVAQSGYCIIVCNTYLYSYIKTQYENKLILLDTEGRPLLMNEYSFMLFCTTHANKIAGRFYETQGGDHDT